jgi:beta-lactamase class A
MKKPIESPPSPLTQVSDQTAEQVNRIRRNAELFNGQAGFLAKNLKTGKIVAFNEHQVFPTASTHKLLVAMATYKYLYWEVPADKKQQYDLYIKSMMQESDNPAFFRLVRELESSKPDALNQVLKDLQLKNTWIHSEDAFRQFGYHSVTTPYEMAIVFETIYQELYLGKEVSIILKEALAKTLFQEEIPRFMQKNKVMHKAGSLPGMLCDVGIIDDGKDQILISFFTTSKQPEQQSSLYIADTSAELYNALRSR